MKEVSDDILMQRVAKGNLDISRILFERHHKHIFNFLFKMSGDSILSEDLTQEVFYKLIKYRTSFNDGKFIPWIFSIARNSLSTHYRRTKEHHHCLDNLSDQYLQAEDEKENEYSGLMEALNKLDKTDKELLLLHRFHQIRYRELAEITGSTPGAVKTKMSRAMKKLKKIYFENE